MRSPGEQRRRIDFQRVALDDAQFARIGFPELGQRRNTAPVTLDRGHLCARGEQRSRQAAGTGPDLQHLGARKRSRHRRDAGEQLPIEQEILPQRLAGAQTVPGDDVAQGGEGRRRRTGRRGIAHARARRSAACPAIAIAAIIAPGCARSLPARLNAVP